jgi:hypothetical protein
MQRVGSLVQRLRDLTVQAAVIAAADRIVYDL